MDVVSFLRTLHENPLDPSSPALPVFEGDLTPQDSVSGPYAVVLGLPENARGSTLSGQTDIEGTVDVILEHPAINGVRPHKRTLIALRNQVLRAPLYVTEAGYNLPLVRPLKYLSGTQPGAAYQDNTTLTATCRFRAVWRLSLKE